MSERGASGVAATVREHWRTIMMVVVGALGAGVFVALIITLGDANRERDRALTLQSRSYEVMILTRTLAGTMARAEATLGRFVISGDRRLGQLYSDEWVQAGQQIDRLDTTVGDNPVQQARVFALRQAYRERGDELALIALSTRYKQNNQALARYYQARNAAALGRIVALLDGFIATERTLLASRTNVAMQSVARSNQAAKWFAVFGVALIVGAIVLGWFTARAFTDRAIAAADTDAALIRAAVLEAAVAEATADLHAEALEREAAEGKLRQMQKLEAVGQLTGGIAHDFNNMLAVVLGGIELARRRLADGGDVARHLDSAAEGASRASALTRRLLAFARAEPLLPQAAAAGAIIAGMSELLDRTIGDGIRIVVRDKADAWQVWIDRHGLENAILNLAVNARDAMDGRGVLTIATGVTTLAEGQIGQCPAGDYVTVAVSDTGCGMPAHVVERVFEPFFTTKPVGKGTGLGLSQIFGFVRQSDGEIAIASTPARGTTVTIYLPRHAAAGAIAATPLPLALAIEPAPRDALDILVIEDDPRVLAATIETLHELGHRPVACGNPLDATAVARTMQSIDLIMSDVLMPGLTGPELIGALKLMLPDVAVLFVTGFAGEAEGGFGGHTVLRKPFTIAALTAALDEAVTARAAHPPARIAAAG